MVKINRLVQLVSTLALAWLVITLVFREVEVPVWAFVLVFATVVLSVVTQMLTFRSEQSRKGSQTST